MIPENEEALLKEALRIQNLDSFKVIDEILSYYACPEQCNGTCCRGLEIPLGESDIERIGRENPKNKPILETLVQPGETFNYWGISVNADKTFPEKPCPFLNGRTSLCKIQKVKPQSCKVYPFLTKPNDDPQDPIKYEIALCLMGFDIFVDYVIKMMAFRDQIPPEEIDVITEFMMTYVVADKTKKESIKSAKFPELRYLQMFLFYLKTDDAVQRVYSRNQFKSNLQKEVLKLLREK